MAERLDDPRRNDYIAKDSLDMLRLLRGDDPDARVAAAITTTFEQGLTILNAEFSRETARGCALAGRAAAGRDDPAVVAASLAALVR